jgi:ABC-2 type transport system permease protein
VSDTELRRAGSTAPGAPRRVRGAGRGAGLLSVAMAIARRSLVNITRIPAAFVPILAMPIFFVIAFSGSFTALTDLPQFPTDNILDWMVPFALIQGAAFAGFAAGFGTVRDIETGFYDRFLLAPSSRAALLLGPLLASTVRATITYVVVLGFGLVLGTDLPGGVLGAVMLWVAAMGVAAMATGWAMGLVYRVPNQRAGPILQIGIFFSMFLSIGQVPLEAQIGWVRQVARVNPITNILRLGRQGFLGDVTWDLTWPGLVAIAASLAVLWLFAHRGLKKLTTA